MKSSPQDQERVFVVAIRDGFPEYKAAFPVVTRQSFLRGGGYGVSWKLGRMRIPASDADWWAFVKKRRPHFHLDVVPAGSGRVTVSLYRVDFRGVSNKLRIGEANVFRWKKLEVVPDAKELAQKMEELLGALSLREFRNWEDRLAKRIRTAKTKRAGR